MSRHATPSVLSSYLDEQIGADEARRLEEHLDECRECRDRLEGLRRVVDALGDLEPVAPPPGLGLELQRQLARATPPFAERDSLGSAAGRSILPPAVLASLGVVLALAVIMLLLLQALQGSGGGQSAPPPRPADVTERARVVIGERAFRRSANGWVEETVSDAEAETARSVERQDLLTEPSDELARVLETLRGELTLRIDGEVVRVAPQSGS